MAKLVESNTAFECELRDGCALIRLKKNAMAIAMDVSVRDKYLNTLDQLELDPEVSGLILINDEEFPGQDEFKRIMERIIEDTSLEKVVAYRFRHWISEIMHRLLCFPKPLVAGLSGSITFEELGRYLVCDRLIVSDDFLARNVNLDLGMPPGPLLTFFLPRILGLRKALKVLTEDATISATGAIDLGFVDKVVSKAEFEQECMTEMQRLLHLPSSLVSTTRELIFSQIDKFEDHVEQSMRKKMHFIQLSRKR